MVGVGSPRPPGEQSPTHPHPTPPSAPHHAPGPPQVNLNELSRKLGLGSGSLRFADEATMVEKLKVLRLTFDPFDL